MRSYPGMEISRNRATSSSEIFSSANDRSNSRRHSCSCPGLAQLSTIRSRPIVGHLFHVLGLDPATRRPDSLSEEDEDSDPHSNSRIILRSCYEKTFTCSNLRLPVHPRGHSGAYLSPEGTPARTRLPSYLRDSPSRHHRRQLL